MTSIRGKQPLGLLVPGLPYFVISASQNRCLMSRFSTESGRAGRRCDRRDPNRIRTGRRRRRLTRRGLSDAGIERAARDHGVVVHPMSRLYVEAPAQSARMLGFSGYPRQLIAPAIARLARAFAR